MIDGRGFDGICVILSVYLVLHLSQATLEDVLPWNNTCVAEQGSIIGNGDL